MRSGSLLLEVVVVLARLGTTAFGGPAAHVAMLEEECIVRRRWCDRRHFLDALAVSSLVPGPTSTELAMHLGRLRAGWPGLLAGGLAWIAPGTVIACVLAWVYQRAGGLPGTVLVLETLRPAVLVILADAVHRLARTALPDRIHVLWGIAAAAIALAGASEVAVVLGALGLALVLGGAAPGRLRAVPLGEVFAVFFGIGATLLGSGYVLVGYLQDALVPRGWLDDARLLDVIAAGQVTPGPLFSSATFAGWLIAGLPGALVATAGIFLPGFLFVAATGPLLERIRQRARIRGALDAVNAAVVGLIAAVLLRLVPEALGDAVQWLVAVLGVLALASGRVGTTAVVLAALAAGLLRTLG